MTLAGLTLPDLSTFDPPLAGEGSLDPMGLAATSDRLADRLVPGVRARMQRMRFVTAMAVGATACETLVDVPPSDRISTPPICFEWLVIEGFARRLAPHQIPAGVPGSQKAREVVNRRQRLSAATYLKGPANFGFNGVYKPFAVDAGVVTADLEPSRRCAELTRAWEVEQGFRGFTDAVQGTEGGRLRTRIRDEVRNAILAGRCVTGPGSWLFGQLASSLHPDLASAGERRALRSLILDDAHETRAELARHLVEVDEGLNESEMLEAVRPGCSAALRAIVDAVVAYERFAAMLDVAFRTLCSVSYGLGSQPLTPGSVSEHPTIVRCAEKLPARYRDAAGKMAVTGGDSGLEEQLGDFAIGRPPDELVEVLLGHHERVQAAKSPGGKRSWFEPHGNGWIVRAPPYGTGDEPELGHWFVHPIRVAALRRFLEDTRP